MAEATQGLEYGQPVSGHPGIRLVRADDSTQSVQAEVEGVPQADHIEFMGERFRLAEKVSIMPLMAYANSANGGADSDDMKGLAAMYGLIRSVIHRPPLFGEDGQRQRDEDGHLMRDEREWNRFERVAMDEMAEGEDLMDVVKKAMEIFSARPTARREVSSASSPQTSETSKPVSSSPVTPPQADGLIPVASLGH